MGSVGPAVAAGGRNRAATVHAHAMETVLSRGGGLWEQSWLQEGGTNMWLSF